MPINPITSLTNSLKDINYLPKLTQETKRQSIFIFVKEIEFVVKNLPTKKNPGPDDFHNKSYQRFKGKIITILFSLFQKTGNMIKYVENPKKSIENVPKLIN